MGRTLSFACVAVLLTSLFSLRSLSTIQDAIEEERRVSEMPVAVAAPAARRVAPVQPRRALVAQRPASPAATAPAVSESPRPPAPKPADKRRTRNQVEEAKLTRALADLRSDDWKKRRLAANALEELGPLAEPAIALLVAMLADASPPLPAANRQTGRLIIRDEGATPGEAAANALGAIGKAALEPVRMALGSKSLHARENAATALAAMDAREAVGDVAQALGDLRSSQTNRHLESYRSAIIAALGKLKGPRAVSALLNVVDRDIYNSNVCRAIGMLGQCGDERAVPKLRELLRRSDEANVRNNCLQALVAILGSRSFADQVAALHDPDALCRQNAETHIRTFKDPALLPELVHLLRSTDVAERRAAASALEFLQHKDSVPALINALGDNDVEVRRRTSLALQLFHDPRAAESLVRLVRSRDDRQVRRNAILGLRGIANPSAIAAVAEVLAGDGDAELRLDAAHFLNGDTIARDAPVAVAAMEAALNDSNPKVRAVAKGWQNVRDHLGKSRR